MALAIPTTNPDVLAAKRERLQVLEVQAAQRGYEAPPHIVNEIRDLRREIDDAAVPETDAERFVFLRDLIQLGRQETAELRRDVRYLYVLLPVLVVLLIIAMAILVVL